MPTIADVLAAEFIAAGNDIERGRDRAAAAATAYIGRRLRQLERRFPRHVFIFSHRRSDGRLAVYPAVARVNDVQSLLSLLCSRSTRWRTMAGLRRVEMDLRAVSYRVEHDFDRLLGRIAVSGAPGRLGAPSAAPAIARAYDLAMVASQQDDMRRLNRPLASERTASGLARHPASPLAAAGTSPAPGPSRRSSRPIVQGAG